MAGEMEKDYKHKDLALKCGGQFFPLPVESFGFWMPESFQTLRTIAAKTTTYNSIGLQQDVLQPLTATLCLIVAT